MGQQRYGNNWRPSGKQWPDLRCTVVGHGSRTEAAKWPIGHAADEVVAPIGRWIGHEEDLVATRASEGVDRRVVHTVADTGDGTLAWTCASLVDRPSTEGRARKLETADINSLS